MQDVRIVQISLQPIVYFKLKNASHVVERSADWKQTRVFANNIHYTHLSAKHVVSVSKQDEWGN